MQGDKIRVFITDDHRLLIDSLINLLTGQNPDLSFSENHLEDLSRMNREDELVFVGRAENAEQMLERLQSMNHNIDVILLDIRLPGMNGIEAMKQVKALYPDIKVVLLTEKNERSSVENALRNQADGYISKSMGKNEFLEGIRKVARGELVVMVPAIKAPKILDPERPTLSEMETTILRLIIEGKIADEISTNVHLTTHNVNRYKRILMEKFKVNNTASLVREAIRLGFYEP